MLGTFVPSTITSLRAPLLGQPLLVIEAVELQLKELASLFSLEEVEVERRLPSVISFAISSRTIFSRAVALVLASFYSWTLDIRGRLKNVEDLKVEAEDC